jgi:4-hydroxy-3-polyprenylbenzoate decarboxylase
MTPSNTQKRRILFGITGASGALYAKLLLEELLKSDAEIHLIISPAAMLVLREELGIEFADGHFDASRFIGKSIPENRVILHDYRDLTAGPASGTFRAHAMVICPCSMKTLGALATGTGSSLITRAADACLKERRRLVVVPRETPLNLIHIRNMLAITEAGAVVLPAMPGFYHRPASLEELARHLVLKMMDSLGIENSIGYRWKD